MDRGSRAEMVAGHRKKVWDGDFSVVHSQMIVAVCLHLQKCVLRSLTSNE